MAKRVGKYRAVTASEALLLAGGAKPECECHGMPMWWMKDGQCVAGGYWGCSVEMRARTSRWRAKTREHRRAVPAAEAYERDGENRPVCECGCGRTKQWYSDFGSPRGGYYRCPVKSQKTREAQARYRERNYDAVTKRQAVYDRKRIASLKEAGLCTGCGKNEPITKTLCKKCNDKKKLRNHALRRRRKEEGKCRCGQDPIAGLAMCQNCMDNTRYSYRRRANRLDQAKIDAILTANPWLEKYI